MPYIITSPVLWMRLISFFSLSLLRPAAEKKTEGCERRRLGTDGCTGDWYCIVVTDMGLIGDVPAMKNGAIGCAVRSG